MKTLLIAITLLISANLLADELKWVDEQIEAIKPTRDGVSKASINSIKNPFIFFSKNTKKEGKSSSALRGRKARSSSTNSRAFSKKVIYKTNLNLNLHAIINRSALINGKWYKVNDKVGRYTIIAINRTTLVLSYKSKKILLSTGSKNKNLKFNNN